MLGKRTIDLTVVGVASAIACSIPNHIQQSMRQCFVLQPSKILSQRNVSVLVVVVIIIIVTIITVIIGTAIW
jgi:uncharacterized membrane protein